MNQSTPIGFAGRPIQLVTRYRHILASVTRVEFAKKYSGSLIGKFWIVLYPALLLSMYLFIYAIVFQMQLPGGTRLDYVIFVFCGLIPYIGFMEAVSSGCVAIKQNIHLIKNVMLPIELIPVRYVLMSMLTELVGLGLLLVLIILNGSLSWRLIGLPVAVGLQCMMLTGLVWFIAPLGMALPDTGYFVNLGVLFLMFISPIGFRPDMVPGAFRFTLYLNPIYYMTETYRAMLIPGYSSPYLLTFVYGFMSMSSFFAGSGFFHRFKRVLVEYE